MADAEPTPVRIEEEAGVPDDGTLGGYFEVHRRPPAFEGSDGHPYTVSPEVEQTENLRAPYAGFLVFPCWAETGIGIVGHVETPVLVERRSSRESLEWMASLPLHTVQDYLEQALTRNRTEPI
jgi:hypothetical protein